VNPHSSSIKKERTLMSSVRNTARVLMERRAVSVPLVEDGAEQLTEGALFAQKHYDHLARLLATQKDHLPADKWQVVHDFVQQVLSSDNPAFDATGFTAAASKPRPALVQPTILGRPSGSRAMFTNRL